MSQWVGSVTAGTINLVRVGGKGSGLLSLVGPLLLIGGVVALLVAFSAQIEIVLTVLAASVLVGMAARMAWEPITDKRADRIEARWRRDMALASLEARRRLALPPAPPVKVEAYVVDRDREPEPIDLDALGA